MAFIFGGSTGLSPEQVAQQRKIAEALAARTLGAAPQNVGEGLSAIGQALAARAMLGRVNKAEESGRASASSAFSDYLSGGGTSAAAASPTPDDLDSIVRTVYGEAANQPPEGQRAVAEVILNRARESGMSPHDVVMAKGQFEPWGSRRSELEGLDTNSPVYKAIMANILPALAPDDPTGGADHFFAPKAQAALGRAPPAWAEGQQGTDIGDHRFFNLQGGQTTQAGGAGIDPKLAQLLSGPNSAWLSESQRSVLNALLEKQMAPPKEPPMAVQEYEYGQTHPGFLNYQRGLKGGGVSPGFQVDAEGKQTFVPGGPHDPETIRAEAEARNSAQDLGGDAGSIAQAIINGDQPPILTGLYKLGGPVRAELENQGYDLTKSKMDWDATTKLLGTMNGATQTRLRQAVMFVNESLGLVDELAQKWKAGNYPLFNKITLRAALEGVAGPEAQSLARQLKQQVTDIQSELAVVYKGGNSPTDMGLQQASEMINVNDPMQTVLDATDLIRRNMKYRTSSLKLATAGISGSQYNPMEQQQPEAPATALPAPVETAPASPAGTAIPEGVDPKLWELMTPEERALWQ